MLAVLAAGCADTQRSNFTRTDASPTAAVALAAITLYTPDPILAQRVPDFTAFSDYLKRIVADADAYCSSLPRGTPQGGDFVVALKTNGTSRFWCEFSSGRVDQKQIRELELRLAKLPTPTVRHGPVAALLHVGVWGGTNQTHQRQAAGQMYFPKQWHDAAAKDPRKTVTVPDGILDLVWPK
jgi:hypothetical protein